MKISTLLSVLFIYLGAPILFAFHQAEHDEHCHSHDEQIATACHNAVEHQGSKYACSDKAHLTKAVHKCAADQPFVFPSFIQPFDAKVQLHLIAVEAVSKTVHASTFTTRQRLSFGNKGPPILS